MASHIPEEVSSGVINVRLFAIIDNTMPPRDPDEDDEDDDEEEDEDRDEPPVVHEPDED
jgi:hypothetical protein